MFSMIAKSMSSNSAEGKKTVMVFGTFDHLHPGHHFLLREAEKRGDNLIVIIARDATVLKIKGRTPRENELQRRQAVSTFLPQATVVLGDSSDFLVPLHRYAPNIILLGYDQGLPPGIRTEDLHCAIERLPALCPEIYKSSLM